VIVDLAAERGGNCELSRDNEVVVSGDVTIFGLVNLASSIPYHASQLYSRAASNFLLHLAPKGALDPERDDEIVRETLVARGGAIVHPRVRAAREREASSPTPS
jgi:NAD(P) transhydrogenase subunit alpha